MRLRLVLAVASPIIIASVGAPAAPRADAVRPCPSGATRHGAAPPDGLSVWCEQGGVHHGPFTMWYPSGQVMRRGFVDHGKLQGEQRSWYPNGQLADRVFYRAGVPAGRWSHWYRDGTRASQREYRGGVLHGRLYRWNPDGKLVYAARYRHGALVWESKPRIPMPLAPSADDTDAVSHCCILARAGTKSNGPKAVQRSFRSCMRAAGLEESPLDCKLATADDHALEECIRRGITAGSPRLWTCRSLVGLAREHLDRKQYLALVGQQTFLSYCRSLPSLQSAQVTYLQVVATHEKTDWLREYNAVVRAAKARKKNGPPPAPLKPEVWSCAASTAPPP